MQCPTPDLRGIGFSHEDKLFFDYGFIMDGVSKLLRLQKEDPTVEQIGYFPDPQLYQFQSPVPFEPGTQLKIYVSKIILVFGKLLEIYMAPFTNLSILLIASLNDVVVQ